MKNIYITMIPLQGNLTKFNYVPQDDIICDKDLETAFPIIPVIKATADPDIENKVIVLQMKNSDTERNLGLFREELKSIGVDPACIVVIELEEDSRYETGANMFLDLMGEIEDDADVFGCITYGTKMMTALVTCALSAVRYVKKNTFVQSICYGQVDREKGQVIQARIWNVSGLLHILDEVKKFTDLRIQHPEELLRKILLINE